MGIPYIKEDVFRKSSVSRRQGYEFLHDDSYSRRLHSDLDREETHGRPRIISPEKMREMEQILKEEGIKACVMTWDQLGFEVGLDCIEQTIKNAMGKMKYRKCIACKKGWVNKKTAKDRVEWSRVMLERYHQPADWYRMQFIDKVYFG